MAQQQPGRAPVIHDRLAIPLQLPPLAGARSNDPGASQGADAVPPAPGFPPVAPAGGDSLEAVLVERRRQIEQFGHTPQADAALALAHLPKLARQFAADAIDDVQFQRGDWRRNARRHLARAGAMVLAAIDRLDAEPADDFTGENSL